MKTPRPSQLVAIVGGSGAGKGWLVERLRRVLGNQACHLSLDNFYHDRGDLAPARRARLNFDSPRAIDWPLAERTLRDCRAGRATPVPRYDFVTHRRRPAAGLWQPAPLVLVEGLSLLVHAPVRELFAFTIYLDCPADLRLRRRLHRDVAERGRSPGAVRCQFRRTVAPMHARHVAPQRQWADLTLTQPYRPADLRRLAARLWTLVTAPAPLRPWLRLPFQHELQTHLNHHELSA